jgi:hypothetical protein
MFISNRMVLNTNVEVNFKIKITTKERQSFHYTCHFSASLSFHLRAQSSDIVISCYLATNNLVTLQQNPFVNNINLMVETSSETNSDTAS